jgi:hypothetical protein
MVVLSNRDQGQAPLTCLALLILAPDLEVCLQLLYMGPLLQAEGVEVQAEGLAHYGKDTQGLIFQMYYILRKN